ncbi:phosphatase PAP2 family protein [Dactylosporangium sp. NPDC006015]|uniref:phosphatase PAP2 family protein n=1 Tax=Dactylosporangium sp. NPDC006015 TaxID=3154576 RepID=UPI00339E734C
MDRTPRHLRTWLLAVAAAATAGFLALTAVVVAHVAVVERFDNGVSSTARQFAAGHVRWRTLMSFVTHTGDSGVLVSLALLTFIVLAWRQQWQAALLAVAAPAASVAIRVTVLHLVARERPVDRLTAISGWSFPSGHTTSSGVAAGVAILLVLAYVRREPLRTALIVTAAGWAVLVGVSRVALLAHWPTDVLAGWFLATAVTTAFAAGRTGAAKQPQQPAS